MFCPNCGTKNNEDAQFCEKCGTRLNTGGTPGTGRSLGAQQVPPSQRVPDSAYDNGRDKKPSTVLVVLGYILAVLGGLIGLIIGAYLYTRDNRESKTHGRNIMIIAIIMMVLGIVAGFWVYSTTMSQLQNSYTPTTNYGNTATTQTNTQTASSTSIPVSQVPGLGQQVYGSGSGFSTITYNGLTLTSNQCLYILSRGIVMLNSGQSGNIPIKSYGNPDDPYGTVTSATITKSQYVDMAQRTYTWMDANGKSPNYVGITSSGQPDLSTSSLINLYAKVLTQYKSTGQLPSAINIP